MPCVYSLGSGLPQSETLRLQKNHVCGKESTITHGGIPPAKQSSDTKPLVDSETILD